MWMNPIRLIANLRLNTNPRRQLLATLVGAVIVFVVLGLVSANMVLPHVLRIEWTRPLFPWDPIQKVPKVVLLLLYAALLCAGMLVIALLVRIFNATESGTARVVDRLRGLADVFVHIKINTAATILLIVCLPLVWALFVTPFNVPNEFLALQTQTRMANGDKQPSLDFLADRQLEGLKIPPPGMSSREPFFLSLTGSAAYEKGRELVFSFPELYWFNEPTGTLEIHRIGNTNQYQTLLSIAPPSAVADLQRRFRDDMGDALALATRQYSAEEKDFLKRNRPELERALVLGRFFYHHNFIFSAAVARAQNAEVEHGSQYGKGLTQGFAAVIAAVPENFRLNAYLLFLYVSYPLYLLLLVAVGRACGLTPWQQFFAVAATIASFLLSEIETVRLGVGLAPWRHLFDVIVLYALWRYGRHPSLPNWMLVAATVFVSIYWSLEMGIFIGLSAAGALLALAIQQRNVRLLGFFAGLVLVVLVSWFVSDPHAQALTWPVLAGINTPSVPFGFISGAAAFSCGLLAAWLWLARRLDGDEKALGWWCMAGAVVFYSAASIIYLIFYPRPHHLVPVIPAMALGLAGGWALFIHGSQGGMVRLRMRIVATAATAALVLGVAVLALLRTVEVVGENRIFTNHITHRWEFPAAQLMSTTDPKLLEQSVAMIRARNPQAVVDILSPWEVALLPLSGKGKNGPFVVSFDSLVTEREVNLLADHLVHHGNEMIFMDSRLATGHYELPLLEDAYMNNRLLASVLRVRAHATLRKVFTKIQGCYRLEEQGPLISAYRRVTESCLK